jgi:hypothetical protein
LTTSGVLKMSQDSCTEEGLMMRTLVLSTVVMALALLTGAPAAAAQSGDEVAVAQAVRLEEPRTN